MKHIPYFNSNFLLLFLGCRNCCIQWECHPKQCCCRGILPYINVYPLWLYSGNLGSYWISRIWFLRFCSLWLVGEWLCTVCRIENGVKHLNHMINRASFFGLQCLILQKAGIRWEKYFTNRRSLLTNGFLGGLFVSLHHAIVSFITAKKI